MTRTERPTAQPAGGAGEDHGPGGGPHHDGGRPQRGVAAGAGGGYGVVEVVNVAEDGDDVGDAEPTERDVPGARCPYRPKCPA
jgi:hypothetical protein